MVKQALVASSNRANLELMTIMLMRYAPHAHVVAVRTSDEAISEALQGDYAAVVIDNTIDGKVDGLETVRQVKTGQPDVPLYFASASDISAEALLAGASGFIEKPDLHHPMALIALRYLVSP